MSTFRNCENLVKVLKDIAAGNRIKDKDSKHDRDNPMKTRTPSPNSWDGLKLYSSELPGGYRYLLTNAEKTKIFILVGDT